MAASRVLLTINVLVSALLRGGKPDRCLEAARQGRIVLVSSMHIVRELVDALSRPRLAVDEEDIAAFLEELAELADIVPVLDAPPGVCRDLDDEPVLLAALLGRADCVVTGDRDLLELADPPVPVLTVDELLEGLPA